MLKCNMEDHLNSVHDTILRSRASSNTIRDGLPVVNLAE